MNPHAFPITGELGRLDTLALADALAHELLARLLRDGLTLPIGVTVKAVNERSGLTVSISNGRELALFDAADSPRLTSPRPLTSQQRAIVAACNRTTPTTAKRIARALGKRVRRHAVGQRPVQSLVVVEVRSTAVARCAVPALRQNSVGRYPRISHCATAAPRTRCPGNGPDHPC